MKTKEQLCERCHENPKYWLADDICETCDDYLRQLREDIYRLNLKATI